MSLLVKAVVGLLLLAVLSAAVLAPAPHRVPSRGVLRRLLLGVLALYGAAVAAALAQRASCAVAASALGVGVSALAGWLSRGAAAGGEDPPGGDTDDRSPGPAPEPGGGVDWTRFDRERAGWAQRRPTPGPPTPRPPIPRPPPARR